MLVSGYYRLTEFMQSCNPDLYASLFFSPPSQNEVVGTNTAGMEKGRTQQLFI